MQGRPSNDISASLMGTPYVHTCPGCQVRLRCVFTITRVLAPATPVNMMTKPKLLTFTGPVPEHHASSSRPSGVDRRAEHPRQDTTLCSFLPFEEALRTAMQIRTGRQMREYLYSLMPSNVVYWGNSWFCLNLGLCKCGFSGQGCFFLSNQTHAHTMLNDLA